MHADGTPRWVYERGRGVVGESGEMEYLDGAIVDVTRRKLAEEHLEHLAFHDALTGLANRPRFEAALVEAIALATARGTRVATLFVDLDDFKLINDSFGHGVGDDVLVSVARRLQASLPFGTLVARHGGDEFLVLAGDLEGDVTEAIARLAGHIRAAVSAPLAIGDAELYVCASVGASVYPDDAGDASDLLKRADTALYASKEGGRDGFRRFAAGARDPERELSLAAGLRRAVERDEFALHYQPLVDLTTGRPVGVEALIRWQRPSGLLMPGDFLPVAVRSGQIAPITEWVVSEACQQSRTWRDAGFDLFVSVNLPPVFWEPTSIRRIMATIDAFGLQPDRMMLEITEEAATEEITALGPVLHELHARGLRLAIDDFGSSHSSLGRLRQLRFTTLKIDRGFVRDIPYDEGAGVLVETMISLARSLGLQSLAEGVEHEAQRRFLVERGCQLAQGFLFAMPAPAAEVTAALTAARDVDARRAA